MTQSGVLTTALGLVASVLAIAILVWLRRDGRDVRVGPWPGLSGRGAATLGAGALLLGGAQWLLGRPEVDVLARGALPWIPLQSLSATAVLVAIARLTHMPGAAAAACGAYLLPRSVASLLVPTLPAPALLLAPTVLMELALWLRKSDLAALRNVWPRRGPPKKRRRPPPGPRAITVIRAAAGGATFGLAFGLLEPGYETLLGADPAAWSFESSLTATLLAAALSATTAAIMAAVVSPWHDRQALPK